MKKVSLVAVVVFILVGILSTSLVSAQDDAPACDPEQISGAMEVIGETFTGMQDLTALPEEPTPADFSVMVMTLDSFDYGYWQGFNEGLEEGETCAEVVYLGTTSGYVFDELLIVSILSALGVHEEAADNADGATTFIDQAEARQAALETSMEGVSATFDALEAGEEVELGVEYPECTEDDFSAAQEGMEQIIGTYQEFADGLDGATGTDLSALVAGFAELSAGYWGEFVPALPACAEIQEFATNFGLLMDDTVIATGLLRLAELESESGDAEVAETLANSAAARAEDIQATAEEVFASEEEE